MIHAERRLSSIKRRRPQSGATIVVLSLVLAFFVVGVIGIFSFDVSSHNSCRDELHSACEAAALAAAAALASSNDTDPVASHNAARDAAQQTFVANSVMGTLLSNTTLLDSQNTSAQAASAANPGPGAAVCYVEFLKADGTVASWSDPAGQLVHVVATFGEQPPFAGYVGLGTINVTAQSQAGLPTMDIVMCFDVSSSIDDQSLVTFVKRYWNGSAIDYKIAKMQSGAPANGTIYQILSPAAVGSAVNLERPQALESSGRSSSSTPMTFDAWLRQSPSGTDYGPPGNYPSGAVSGNPSDFTDMVANLDGKPVFSPPFTYVDSNGASWPFPSLGAVVEASRGNLENTSIFNASKADTAMPPGFMPRAGYQAAYFQAAHNLAMPIAAARKAATTFFQIMAKNSQANFGFISFGSGISTSPTKTDSTTYAIANGYTPGGQITPPFPGIPLGANQLNTIVNNLIPLTVADGSTDIGDAAQEAVNELVNNGRPGATKAVIFFTDGQPNMGPSWLPAAQEAKQKGIAIYTVGMAQNPAIIPGECDNLNDKAGKPINYVDPLTGVPGSYTPTTDGMAAVAQNGGKFFLVTNKGDLNYVFENIARQLVRLRCR